MPGVVPPASYPSGGRPPSTEDSRPPSPLAPAPPGKRRPGAVGGVVPQSAAGSSPFVVGQDVEVTIEDVAQGGWCVARPEGLPVMFVRHALPGESVVAHVTEVTSKFARADAVRVLRSSPDRVDAPCQHARPGGCGGCDWQHASLPAQRALKATVITQQLRRLAGIDLEVEVEPLPGDERRPSGPVRKRERAARRALAGAPASSSRSTATESPACAGTARTG